MNRVSNAAVLASLAVVAVVGGTQSAAAQSAPTPPQGDTWESIAKLPDWSGVWEVTFGGGPRGAGEPPQFTPAYAAKLKDYQDKQKSGEIEDGPSANCVPNGMPGIMTQPYPMEILFTPGKITIVIEAYSQWRQIFTDGRAHPEDPDLTWNGHSTGHWEGDTLVVDSVGFAPDTFLGNGGARHSDKMRIVERMRVSAPDVLTIETTITDPEALTKPFVRTASYGRHRDWTIAEYVCQQNNRNFTTDDGKSGVNLKRGEEQ